MVSIMGLDDFGLCRACITRCTILIVFSFSFLVSVKS